MDSGARGCRASAVVRGLQPAASALCGKMLTLVIKLLAVAAEMP